MGTPRRLWFHPPSKNIRTRDTRKLRILRLFRRPPSLPGIQTRLCGYPGPRTSLHATLSHRRGSISLQTMVHKYLINFLLSLSTCPGRTRWCSHFWASSSQPSDSTRRRIGGFRGRWCIISRATRTIGSLKKAGIATSLP